MEVVFECLERAKDKLRIIDRFYRRQAGKEDVQKWVLPACQEAFLSPVYTEHAIHKALLKFASELRYLSAEHAPGTPLMSIEGGEALGELLLSETYRRSPEEVSPQITEIVCSMLFHSDCKGVTVYELIPPCLTRSCYA